MTPVLILTKSKTVFIHLDKIIDNGKLVITNREGNIIFKKSILFSFYEIIKLTGQQGGKYWLRIDSEKIKVKKSFQLK